MWPAFSVLQKSKAPVLTLCHRKFICGGEDQYVVGLVAKDQVPNLGHPYIHSTTVLCDSTWCIMICLVIPILSLLLFIQSLYSISNRYNRGE